MAYRINSTILQTDITCIRMRWIHIVTQYTPCIKHILYPAQSSRIQRVEQICRIAYIRLRKTSLYDFWELDRCMRIGFYLSDNVTLLLLLLLDGGGGGCGCSFRILLKCLRFRGDNNANIRCRVTLLFLFLNSFLTLLISRRSFLSLPDSSYLVLAIWSTNGT